MAARRRTARPEPVRARNLALAPDDVFDVFKRGAQALKDLDASFCLVGGLARGFYAEARSTKDVDFAVAAPTDERVDEILRGLRFAGFHEREMFFHKETGALWTARFTFGEDETRMDLLFATSGIEDAVVRDAVVKEVAEGLSVPVVARAHFLAMKCIAGRPHDLADIALLLAGASASEKRRVPSLLKLAPEQKRERGLAVWRLAVEASRVLDPERFVSKKR